MDGEQGETNLNLDEVSVWRRERELKSKTTRGRFEPLGIFVLGYLFLSLCFFPLFGWLHYSLSREVTKLSGQVAGYRDRITLLESTPAIQNKTAGENSLQQGGTQTVVKQEKPADQTAAQPTDSKYQNYTVQSGDNWWTICEKFYGSGTYYAKLLIYNNMKKEGLANGTVIKIPSKEALNTIAN